MSRCLLVHLTTEFVPLTTCVSASLVFSESFDSHWVAKVDGKVIRSEKFSGLLNSFMIKNSESVINVYYQPQKWVNMGFTISIATIVLLGGFGFGKIRQKW